MPLCTCQGRTLEFYQWERGDPKEVLLPALREQIDNMAPAARTNAARPHAAQAPAQAQPRRSPGASPGPWTQPWQSAFPARGDCAQWQRGLRPMLFLGACLAALARGSASLSGEGARLIRGQPLPWVL